MQNEVATPMAVKSVSWFRAGLALLGAILAIGISLSLLLVAQPHLYFAYSAQDLAKSTTAAQTKGFNTPQIGPDGVSYVWTGSSASLSLPQAASKAVKVTIEARSAATAGGADAPIDFTFAAIDLSGYKFSPLDQSFIVGSTGYPTYTFQPDSHNNTFQTFTFELHPYWALAYNQNLNFSLTSPVVTATNPD